MISSSLVIAVYNWPQALECSLLSVVKQKVPPAEVIVADDGSTAAVSELVSKYQRTFPVPLKHVWHEDKGFRLGMIRNKAIASATGNYIIQVDGDIILHPLFIYDHQRAARPGCFIGGSRVLLGKELSEALLNNCNTRISVFDPTIKNRINGLHAPWFGRAIELVKKEKGLYNLRGCNMSFWKEDIIEANGYNEDIIGWGREDTELAIRLYNRGLKRIYFKFQGIAYHLFHNEQDRDQLQKK